MKITELGLEGVFLVEPRVFDDERGFFLETYNDVRYKEKGLNVVFRQDNHSYSGQGTVRGLHYQLKRPQGKLVMAIRGEIFDVAVDIRRGSPSFGQWVGEILSRENHRQLYVPPGFAHGFCVLSEEADVLYKCTDVFTPGDDFGIHWLDAEIGIDWPIHANEAVLSEKDAVNLKLAEVPEENLPKKV